MPEDVAHGKSLDEIRSEYAEKWGCAPEKLELEVLEQPGFFTRQWKVRVKYTDSEATSSEPIPFEHTQQEFSVGQSETKVQWEGERYLIFPAVTVKKVVPFAPGGKLLLNGEQQEIPFQIYAGDRLEFYPVCKNGHLTWTLESRLQGLSIVAKVSHERAGRYILPERIPGEAILDLGQYLQWEELPPQGEVWDETRLQTDLARLGVVHGVHPQAWSEITAVEGTQDVVIAQATMPVPPEPPVLQDFVGVVREEQSKETERIDFFASKLKFVKEGDVLARKIPGKPGVPGKDVFGRELPPPPVKDFQFRPKKNVRLSEDGLEVISACPGLPVRVDQYTYMVENIYVLNRDVDLSTGSIEFPGDVYINGNVQDGFHVFSGGKVEISGAVFKAEIRAEKGLKLQRNVLGGRLIVGEKHVIRSELLRRLRELHEKLKPCLAQTLDLANSPHGKHLKPGQCLKAVLERNFPDLPKSATELEKFVLNTKDELITQELIVSVRTAKHFLAGLGPLDIQAVPFLQRVDRALEQLAENISFEVPEKLSCFVDYVQGAYIECGGTFECRKGVYNSNIRADGDVKIEGVCRGGKIISGGNVEIKELGGSDVSITTVQFPGSKRLKIGYCHPNVVVIVDKEILHIEEHYKQLEVYRERGYVQMDKLKAEPR